MTTPAANLDEVLDLYEAWGGDPYDEELSQLAHALQTAALAEASGAGDHLVVAALLHDVGHLLTLAAAGAPATADDGHERSGAHFLSALFEPAVTAPIARHVDAKRYRCAIDPAHHASLSDGSVRSLRHQGGPMNDVETAVFRSQPGWADAVLLRGWDDEAKVLGLDVPPLSHYYAPLERVVRG